MKKILWKVLQCFRLHAWSTVPYILIEAIFRDYHSGIGRATLNRCEHSDRRMWWTSGAKEVLSRLQMVFVRIPFTSAHLWSMVWSKDITNNALDLTIIIILNLQMRGSELARTIVHSLMIKCWCFIKTQRRFTTFWFHLSTWVLLLIFLIS